MCSGGRGTDWELQAALGRLSSLQAGQKTKHSTDVVLGDEQEYRRNTKAGAKDLGVTAEDITDKKMSKLFTSKKGAGTAMIEERIRLKKLNEAISGGGMVT